MTSTSWKRHARFRGTYGVIASARPAEAVLRAKYLPPRLRLLMHLHAERKGRRHDA